MLDYERHARLPDAFLQRGARRPRRRPCGRCDRCAGAWYPTDVPDGAPRAGARAPAPGRRRDRARGAVADRHGPARRARQGPDRRRRAGRGRAGPSPGSPTSAGGSGCASCSPAPDAAGRRRAAARPASPCSPTGTGSSGPVGRRRRCPPRAARSSSARVGRAPRRGRPAAVRSARSASPTTARTGEPGGNSAFRLAGVWDALRRARRRWPRRWPGSTGPVLLVDDLADSRWTLTVAGRALRLAGAGGVLPFALAVPA